MSRKRAVALAVFLLLILMVGVVSCRSRSANEKKEAAPAAVQIGPEDTVIVREESIASGPAVSGTLSAKEEATVRAQISGSVLSTNADVGEAVSEGAVLARLDPGALVTQQQSAQTAVTSAQVALATAQKELSRQQTLAREGIVAKRDVEMARQSVSQARAALAQAQAQSSASGEQLSYSAVRAPMSGIVSARQVNDGDVVQMGSALFTIVDLGVMQLEAAIPQIRPEWCASECR